MNNIGKGILSILCFVMFIFAAHAEMELHQPKFPPKEWSISIDLKFSKDFYSKIMRMEKAKYENYSEWQRIEFALNSFGDGSIRMTPDHPFITGKVLEDSYNMGAISSVPMAYMPQQDRALAYKKAFDILAKFDFEDSFRAWGPDTAGITVEFDLDLNGRSVHLSFGKCETVESIPDEVIQMLSIFRRSLPSEYERFFDFLKVPRLSPLSVQEKSQIQKCRVHQEWMKIEEVKVVYGDFFVDPEFLKAKNTLFPNSQFVYWGGGLGGSAEKANVLYCESCREAEKKWYEGQGENFEEILKMYRQEDL